MSHFALTGIVKQKGGTVTSDNTQTHTVSTLWKMLAAVHHASKKNKKCQIINHSLNTCEKSHTINGI